MSWSVWAGGVWCCSGPAEELCIGHWCEGISGTVFRCEHCHARIVRYVNGAVTVERESTEWNCAIEAEQIGPTAVQIPADLKGPRGIAGGPGPVGPTMSKEWCETWLVNPDDSPTTVTDPDKVRK